MDSQLGTTNLFLGVMAVASALQILLMIGAGVGMFVLYRRVQRAYVHVLDLISIAEQQHVTPTLTRVNAVLDDVKDVTATMKQETDRLDTAIRSTMDRVDHTAEVVRGIVSGKASRVVGVMRGARVVLETILNTV